MESDTLYPFRDTVEYAVRSASGTEKTIHFRIPSWCDGATISVNGKDIPGLKKPGEWFAVKRAWKAGDVIRLRLPMHVTTDMVVQSILMADALVEEHKAKRGEK